VQKEVDSREDQAFVLFFGGGRAGGGGGEEDGVQVLQARELASLWWGGSEGGRADGINVSLIVYPNYDVRFHVFTLIDIESDFAYNSLGALLPLSYPTSPSPPSSLPPSFPSILTLHFSWRASKRTLVGAPLFRRLVRRVRSPFPAAVCVCEKSVMRKEGREGGGEEGRMRSRIALRPLR